MWVARLGVKGCGCNFEAFGLNLLGHGVVRDLESVLWKAHEGM